MPKVSGQLFSADETTGTNTAATRPRYVIIGTGFSAIVNHATLRRSEWGKARIAGMQIVHLSQGDPWGAYVDHGMGQWGDLLTLPGFFFRPDAASADKFLSSADFASNTEKETRRLKVNWPPAEWIWGRVESIQRKKVGKADKFLIKYKDIQNYPAEEVADYVDLCSGPGLMRVYARTTDRGTAYDFGQRAILFDDVLYKEYQLPDPSGRENKLRRVIGAHTYMNSNIVAGVARACVYGGGPLASSCVERALKIGVDVVYWVSRSEPLNPSFAPGLRYDGLARLEKGKPLPRRLAPIPNETLLFPSRPNVKFAEGYKVAEVRVEVRAGKDKKPIEGILLKFATGQPRGRKGPRFVDPDKPGETALKELFCQQLIISASNQEDDNEPGSTAYIVKDIRKSEERGKLRPIKPVKSNNNVPAIGAVTVGVQTKDEKFRILGTAGLTQEDRAKEDKNTKDPSRLLLWEKSLPAQAHVNLVGATISAAAVAQANGFFQKNPNDCVNIAHLGELWNVWGNENGLAIYNARRQRVDPFSKNRHEDDEDHPLPNIEAGHYTYRWPNEYWKD